MKAYYLYILLAIFVVFFIGCTRTPASFDASMMEEDSSEEKDTISKGSVTEPKSATVDLRQESGSGQTGVLVLSEENRKTKATLAVTNSVSGIEQPAHLHESSCDDLGPVAYPLNNIINGRSETLIDVSLDQLLVQLPLAVNVHKSVAEPKVYVSCGDIKIGAMIKDDAAMEKDKMTVSSYKGKVLAGTTSKYFEFNKADYDRALKENKNILLYFYASWCPICKKEQVDTFAAFNELSDPNLIGFRVNYKDGDDDAEEKALAQQYGVAYQHTKVILKDGKQVAKFPDSWNKQRYLDELAKD